MDDGIVGGEFPKLVFAGCGGFLLPGAPTRAGAPNEEFGGGGGVVAEEPA